MKYKKKGDRVSEWERDTKTVTKCCIEYAKKQSGNKYIFLALAAASSTKYVHHRFAFDIQPPLLLSELFWWANKSFLPFINSLASALFRMIIKTLSNDVIILIYDFFAFSLFFFSSRMANLLFEFELSRNILIEFTFPPSFINPFSYHRMILSCRKDVNF